MFKLFSRNAVKNISPIELAKMIDDDNNLVVLDVRTPEEFARDGHIANSRLMPLSTVSYRMNELPKDRTIVCVCRSGARSSVACESLENAGFSDVFNMGGGMVAWKRAGLATR